jgi:adenine phosphoribosyltransferase
MDLTPYIRSIPDFPQPGILFRDITPLLQEPKAYQAALDEMAAWAEERRPTAIIGIESRGFIFGMPVATRLRLPFVPVRKPGKLPAARMSIEFSLEYGQSQLDIHADALARGDRALIVDDVLATGGTAQAACKLAEMLQAEVCGVLTLIELGFLSGRDRLAGYDVHALVRYD